MLLDLSLFARVVVSLVLMVLPPLLLSPYYCLRLPVPPSDQLCFVPPTRVKHQLLHALPIWQLWTQPGVAEDRIA